MAVYFSTDSRSDKHGNAPIRLSWHCQDDRFQTTIGLSTKYIISNNRVKDMNYNSKNMTPKEINVILERIEKFIYSCEARALEKGVKLKNGMMRGLFKDYKSMRFTCEKEVMERWIKSTPSNGLYWHKVDGEFYKKLCEAADSVDNEKLYVIFQELFGHSRIFSMPKDEFEGHVELKGEKKKLFVEVSEDEALAAWYMRDLGDNQLQELHKVCK